MTGQIKIKTIPMTYHCEGMMETIKQLLRAKISNRKLNESDLDTCLTEYAKFWYYRNIKNFSVVDSNGKEAKS